MEPQQGGERSDRRYLGTEIGTDDVRVDATMPAGYGKTTLVGEWARHTDSFG